MVDTSINLLTQEEKSQQFKSKAVKFSSVFSVFLVIVVSLVSGFYFFKATSLRTQIKNKEEEIQAARGDITSMESVEILARTLYKKYLVLKDIFENRVFYSDLLSDFNSRIPEGVTVESFAFDRDNTIVIRGTAENWLLVSDFLANFNESGSDSRTEATPLFTKAYLGSAKLDTGSSKTEYNIVIVYDPEAVKYGLEQRL